MIYRSTAEWEIWEAREREIAELREERNYQCEISRLLFKDKAGRPDIDAFETAMRRSKRDKGFFVAFDYSDDVLREIGRFVKADHAVIVPLTVKKILDEQIAGMLV